MKNKKQTAGLNILDWHNFWPKLDLPVAPASNSFVFSYAREFFPGIFAFFSLISLSRNQYSVFFSFVFRIILFYLVPLNLENIDYFQRCNGVTNFTPSLLHPFTPSLPHSFTPSLRHLETRGSSHNKRKECSSENLDLTPTGDLCVRFLSFTITLKNTP